MEDFAQRLRGVIVDCEVIRVLRRARCWTQDGLAEKAGLTSRTIAAAEAGQPIALRSVREIARALEVDPTVLSTELADPLARLRP
jgi:transcriptional regulator with XRE-family HTH domain